MQSKIIYKVLSLVLCLCFLCPLLAGCGGEREDEGKIKIVTTIFPLYDWLCNIVGEKENVEITMLLDNGVDLHSYQPTVADMVIISTCDLFLYVGGASDEWVDDALKEAVNGEMIVIDLLVSLRDRVKTEETVEGMEAEEEEEGEEYDEHIWLSLRNAKAACREIADALETLDPDFAASYESNYASYAQKLDALDGAFAEAAENSAKKTVLFGDRFPFRYLVDDYGLSYYAAFAGCSAETQASFDTVVFLAGKADELGLNSILILEGSDGKIAERIRSCTKAQNQQILTLDSMQSVTSAKAEAGVTYLSLMEQNLSVLSLALQ